MLNEPLGEGGEGPEVGELGAVGEEGAPVNYIQVTPQEKEAIERVSLRTRAFSSSLPFCLEQPQLRSRQCVVPVLYSCFVFFMFCVDKMSGDVYNVKMSYLFSYT